MDELLNCPMCGNAPRLVDLAGWEVLCKCGVSLCLDGPEKEPLIEHWNRRATPPSPSTAPAVDDLAMLVRQLVHSLKKAKPDSDLAARAVDYLQRKGLAGSPLRSESAPTAPIAEDECAAYAKWANENLPQYFSGRAPTWEIVESNVLAETWNAWQARAAISSRPAGEVEATTAKNAAVRFDGEVELPPLPLGIGAGEYIQRDDVRAYGQECARAALASKPAAREVAPINVIIDAVNMMLWLYRRLPRAYERPPFVEKSITDLAKIVGVEVGEYFVERGDAPPLSSEQQATCTRCPIETPYGPATCGECTAREFAESEQQASSPEFPDNSAGAAPAEMVEPSPMYFDALKIVREQQRASVSLVQRRLRISWNAACDMVELMLSRRDVPLEWAPPVYQLAARQKGEPNVG